MMTQKNFWQTPVEFIKGIGPERGKLLKDELGIATYYDLFSHFPYRYIDRSRFYKTTELKDDSTYFQLKGKLVSLRPEGSRFAKKLTGVFSDAYGKVELIWFNRINWIEKLIQPGKEYILFGRPGLYKKKFSFIHPELTAVDETTSFTFSSFMPFYHTTEKMKEKGMDSRAMARYIRALKEKIREPVSEILSPKIISSNKLFARHEAFLNIHFPKGDDSLSKARFRLKFEELFLLQLELLAMKQARVEKKNGFNFPVVGDKFNTYYKEKLPFKLTEAQKRVIREIRSDTVSGFQMNRLLQGDVGSGKTIVALLSLLLAIDNGFQACLMAPTEILAQQHFQYISKQLYGMGTNVTLLTGSTTKAQRKKILPALQNGRIKLIIGTHALIEDTIQFENLGMVVIDEQHRFGVAQRAQLWSKENNAPHVLVMTATPIPRTLAMTLYGDLDVSVMDEMPPGRKYIKTYHRNESLRLRMYGFIREQIAKGRQAYVVYPIIEESETLDYKNLVQGFETLKTVFPQPQYMLSILHGRMSPAEKEYQMGLFRSGKSQIMVATTVIEVGVDVPNATVMVIESAERFGLAQLHQLRGRVGRGAEQSYCILMTAGKLSEVAYRRMKTMEQTNDGFKIAEVDLELRGPGDIQGTRQSGALNLKIANIAVDGQLLALTRSEAVKLFKEDHDLSLKENAVLKNYIEENLQQAKFWSSVS
jgi:ATP-dependent DNA helicase RecG